jgi:hypothetical protein
MNERIRELVRQADPEYGNESGDMPEAIVGDLAIQRFAELIVKKCAMIGNYAYDGGEYPGQMIKEYFGVEE